MGVEDRLGGATIRARAHITKINNAGTLEEGIAQYFQQHVPTSLELGSDVSYV
jgi:hypothetical protein